MSLEHHIPAFDDDVDDNDETYPKPKHSKISGLKSVPSAIATLKKPVVLISGGGIGGLTLGLALQKAGIEFFILEKSPKIKHIGGGLSLSPTVLPALEQLGLYEDIKTFGIPLTILDMYSEDLKYIGAFDSTAFSDLVGCYSYLMARSELVDLLVSKIEPARLLLNKKILSTQQNEAGVVVRTADGSFYHGDILIGADGAYSAVRQNLYKEMDKKGMLPDEDKKEMIIAYISMLGITRPLSTEKYPCLKEEFSNFTTVLANGKPHSWTIASLTNNRFGWGTWFQVTEEEAQQMMFRNSEWGSEANEAVLEQIRGYSVKQGGTLGDLIDLTDSDKISKVYVEQKLFQTWHYGRTALIGDAAHKMNPGGGQGAASAMQDAVVLANCIYELENPSFENIQKALSEYYDLRFEKAKVQSELGTTLGKLMFGQKWTERLLRMVLCNLPKWAQTQSHMKLATYRPILNFLPPPPNRGVVKFLPQKESERYARESESRAKAV
ncbi:hypothetical protein BG004_006468 [Podila humilis]|nr:hypothetical protein BG004_006468 [Podila humilis]